MRMTDFVVREAIVPDLHATTKEGVIREMVESLRGANAFKNAETEEIVKAILKRECSARQASAAASRFHTEAPQR